MDSCTEITVWNSIFIPYVIPFFIGVLASWFVAIRFRILSRNFILEIGNKYYLVEGNCKRRIKNIRARLMLELECGRPVKFNYFEYIFFFVKEDKRNFIPALNPGHTSDTGVNCYAVNDKRTNPSNIYILYRGRRRWVESREIVHNILGFCKDEVEDVEYNEKVKLQKKSEVNEAESQNGFTTLVSEKKKVDADRTSRDRIYRYPLAEPITKDKLDYFKKEVAKAEDAGVTI